MTSCLLISLLVLLITRGINRKICSTKRNEKDFTDFLCNSFDLFLEDREGGWGGEVLKKVCTDTLILIETVPLSNT